MISVALYVKLKKVIISGFWDSPVVRFMASSLCNVESRKTFLFYFGIYETAYSFWNPNIEVQTSLFFVFKIIGGNPLTFFLKAPISIFFSKALVHVPVEKKYKMYTSYTVKFLSELYRVSINFFTIQLGVLYCWNGPFGS